MKTVIPELEMDHFGDFNDSFFSLSQFDVDLQQQQQQQQHVLAGTQRSIQELLQDTDSFLPVECQSFMMNQPITMNASTVAQTEPLPTTFLSYISAPSSTINNLGKLELESLPEFPDTAIVHSHCSSPNTIKQESPSPKQQVSTSFLQQNFDMLPTIPSACQQQNGTTSESTCTTTAIPASQSSLSFTANEELAEILAGINWNLPIVPHADSDKVPIQRLKPATDIQTSPLSSTDIPIGNGKQKKADHNAIERRYRNNINDRITELKNAVPALLHAKLKAKSYAGGSSNNYKRSDNMMMDEDEEEDGGGGGGEEEEFLDGVAVATKLNKATILHKATEYIHHLKRTNNDRKQENDALQHLLAQLPGGPQVLVQYQIQKLQREQKVQQQLAMERQWIKHNQQYRKNAAANKRKRANRRGQFNNNHEDFDTRSLSIISGDHPHTPPSDHDNGLMNNRVFMAVFMATSFFSSAPLTTPAGSENVNNHNHVSRTAIFTLNSTESYNSHESTSNNVNISWMLWMDIWYALRLIIFIACLIRLLFPNFQTWIFGHSFKFRRIHSATRRLRRPLQNSKLKSRPHLSNTTVETHSSLSSGAEKCIRMTQALVYSITIDHNDTSAAMSPKNKLKLVSSLIKELVLFMARHVLGYAIIECHQQQSNFDRWKHTFKWLKLNECECLGGNPFLSRLTLFYHSIRMLNLVDSLQQNEALDDIFYYDNDEKQQQQQQQLSFMRARAYATATLQVNVGISSTYIATWIADYFWGIAISEASEEDIWAFVADDNDNEADTTTTNSGNITTTKTLSTKIPWMETLEVIRQQIPASFSSKSLPVTDALYLSAYAPVLIPTAILSNLHLLNQLESVFQLLIDNMMSSSSSPTDKQQRQGNASTSLFSIYHHSMEDNGIMRVANWFMCVGDTVEALWQHDMTRAENGMLALAKHVPRAMTVPGYHHYQHHVTITTKKKERQSDLDAMAKQQIVHLLAGATMVLENSSNRDGINELAIGEHLRQQRTKRVISTTTTTTAYELEATHVEGRIMALAEFAVMLVSLKAWISTWSQLCSSGNDTSSSSSSSRATVEEEKANTQVRLMTLSLRRMVCRPALVGRLKTQQVIVDRLGRLGHYMDELNSNNNLIDSADECFDLECDDDDDGFSNNNHREQSGAIKQGKLVNHMDKMMAILQGN